MTAAIITGDRELDRALVQVETEIAVKVVVAGVRAAQAGIAAGIRKAIPSRYKQARKSIGSRFKRRSGQGIIKAKTGAAVGKRRRNTGDRGGRPGVGISAANIHWLLMGTAERRHKSGKSTGRMPPLGAVRQGYSAALPTLPPRIQKAMRRTLDREVAKVKR